MTLDPTCTLGFCDTATGIWRAYAPNIDIYDARYPDSNATDIEEAFEAYLQQAIVVTQLNPGWPVPEYKVYSIGNSSIANAMALDRYTPSIDVVAGLLT